MGGGVRQRVTKRRGDGACSGGGGASIMSNVAAGANVPTRR